MIKLTSTGGEPLWVHGDHIIWMQRTTGGDATALRVTPGRFKNRLNVRETPAEIAELVRLMRART